MSGIPAKARSVKEKIKLGMVLYTEEEWKKYKAAAEDDEYNTYQEWLNKREKLKAIIIVK